MKKYKVIVSCEHGGNRIPLSCHDYFRGKNIVLNSHRGWDKGALVLARELAATIRAPLVASETSRLLVDLNRSLHHPGLFSEFTRGCAAETKQDILDKFYLPYRNRVDQLITAAIQKHQSVLHFSIHSFTPGLGNKMRNTDIGLLYDPARNTERKLCINLQETMREMSRNWKVRRNYPYRGNADGFTTWLRKKYTDKQYCGIEIEVNQKILEQGRDWLSVRRHITGSLAKLLS